MFEWYISWMDRIIYTFWIFLTKEPLPALNHWLFALYFFIICHSLKPVNECSREPAICWSLVSFMQTGWHRKYPCFLVCYLWLICSFIKVSEWMQLGLCYMLLPYSMRATTEVYEVRCVFYLYLMKNTFHVYVNWIKFLYREIYGWLSPN